LGKEENVGGRVLIVDDNPVIRKIYRDSLANLGYESYAAECGVSALQSLETIPVPDVIVLDCFMPRMNGDEFIEELRARLPNIAESTIIIGISSLPKETPLIEKFTRMVKVYMERPFPVEDLSALIQKLLRAKKSPS
jgi:CheY-like chemotaxis protein